VIKIWGRASSSNVQALMWAIEELALPHQRQDAGFIYGGNDTPDFLAMNPNGTVPVLQDGENKPIWETGAILRYVAEKYAGDAFWPKDAEERAEVDKWAEWAKINVALKFTAPVFWRVVRTAPSKQDPEAIKQAISVLNGFLAVAETQLGKQSFLASSNLSLADIQFGHLLYRYFDIEIERASFPNIESYYCRLSEREAFKKHVAISYDELRVVD
jgi:glutathione S-transferase